MQHSEKVGRDEWKAISERRDCLKEALSGKNGRLKYVEFQELLHRGDKMRRKRTVMENSAQTLTNEQLSSGMGHTIGTAKQKSIFL